MRILYPLILILFTFSSAFAQNPIEISKEKVKIEGKNYYAHNVKKKETLYSLSKAYGVTVDMIVKSNASLATGLKEGTIIYIPVTETLIEEVAAKSPTVSTTAKKEKQKKYKRHTVKWYEDITDISERYNVPVEAIIALNNLPDGNLKTRQVLQIPDAEFLAGFAASIAANKQLAASDTTSNGAAADSAKLSGSKLGKDLKIALRESLQPLEIALVLPLNTTQPENISLNFMDFYAGALLAINNFKEHKLVVNVYDLTEYTPLHTLLDEPGFSKNQLIIGPARASRIKELMGYTITEKIPLISPLDNSAETLLEESPYLVQVPTGAELQLENLVKQLHKQYQQQPAPVLLVSEKGGADASFVNRSKELLDSLAIPYHNISYGILEGRTISETMITLVDTLSGTPNIALVPSTSEAFVSDAIRNLDICHNYGNTKMVVYGLPKWRNFETINIELYHKLNLHLSIPYFVDYGSEEVEKFLQRYRALYNTEPTPYAYQGYDIAKYFIELANRYGKSFINMEHFTPAQMLQSNFEFKRHKAGVINSATRDIVYNPDYTVTLIK